MRKACLIFFLGTIIFSLLILQARHPRPSEAQTSTGNQAGINITDVDPNRFLQAAKTVGPGGWVTVIATAGQGSQLQEIFDINHSLGDQGVQVVVRRETWGRTPTAEDALSFAAMYGNLNTHGQQIYDMPWNEPNNFAWWDFSTIDQSARAGATYFQASYQSLNKAGLYGNKVIFMAPMVDQFRGNGAEYYQLLRQYDPNVMNYFQAVPMNLYVRYDPDTHNPSANIVDSGTRYREVLERFGFIANIPVLALETGVIIGYGNPIYPPEYPGWLSFYTFLSHVTNAWRADPNFFGFTPLSSASYGSDYLLGELVAVLQQFITPGAVGIYDLSQIQKIFEEWLKAAGLIECLDEEGSFIGYALDEGGCQNLLAFLLPTPTYPACTSPSVETRVSRPDVCTTCDLNPPLTYACATTFTVHDNVSWRWEDSDFVCDATGKHWVERDWGGNIIIDPDQVTVPFVGKKGEEDVKKYLADYFEGTAFYYGPDIDLNDCKKENPNEAERRACQAAVKRVLAEGGVFRKLAPKELQDKLKKEMIERAKKSAGGQIEEGIHDYLIEHGPYKMRLSTITSPPEPPEAPAKKADFDAWRRRYGAWKKTESGKLWAAVPMFSREDSPGQVIASVNTKRKDTVTITPPIREEQVPHLARLFEVTRELQNLLMPWLKEKKAEAQTQTLLASNNPQILGEKTLLVQAEPCKECLDASIVNPIVNNGKVYATLSILHQCPGHGTVGDVSMGPCGVRGQVHSVPPGEHGFSSNHPAIVAPVPISCPGTASLCVEIRAERDVDPSCRQARTIRCQITVDADCNEADTNCGGGLPPPPACGLAEPPSSPACEYESVTDEYPNDTICCNPILIDLKALEQFENPNYTPCEEIIDPATGRIKILNPECKTKVTRLVHRDVKVDLFHPYLDEIWEQTTDSFRGLFNIFRPKVEPPFEDLYAHSYIEYSFSGGSITPESPWKFYFPRLGGIQKAKEWVLETLNPGSQ